MPILRSRHWKQKEFWIATIMRVKVLRNFKTVAVHLEEHDLKSLFVIMLRGGW